MDRARLCRLRSSPLVLAIASLAVTALSATAQEAPLPGVGEVGQGIQWTGFLEPGTLSILDSVRFEARGVVGTEEDRRIATLTLIADGLGLVASGLFPALGGEEVRVALLDGTVPVAEVVVPIDHASPAAVGRAAGALTAGGQVRIGTGAPAALPHSVHVALFHLAGFAAASGEVVPAPRLALDLGARLPVTVGGETHQATTVRFLATTPFPPPSSSAAILQRVDVFTGSALGGASGPSLDFVAESVVPGVLFSGVPMNPDEGTLGVLFDRARGSISGVLLDAETSPAFLVTGRAAGVAATWKAADVGAGASGSSVELAAIGQNIASVQVRGVVTALRTDGGWDLRFQPPGGLGDVPRTVEVDGAPVGEVTVPSPAGVFARTAEPPGGAAVFPIGFEEGAFYGFSWDAPVPIEVPGVGSFTGREVRLVFPLGVGPLAFGGVAIEGLPRLTVTGLAAPAIEDGGPCIASASQLCLAGGRFAVEAAWADPFGGSGGGVAIPLTDDTGSFWFFESANLELMVKVLDACPVFDHFWVFAGGLTNVEVELAVTDTRTGARRVYRNPQGQAFQPIQDTAAFATCQP